MSDSVRNSGPELEFVICHKGSYEPRSAAVLVKWAVSLVQLHGCIATLHAANLLR
jgi:hypothetical protein